MLKDLTITAGTFINKLTNFTQLFSLPITILTISIIKPTHLIMSVASKYQLPASVAYYNNYNNYASQYSAYISTTLAMNKIVIFDWDDTLFPTTAFIRKSSGKELNGDEMKLLSQNVLSIIKKACLLYGSSNVYIVTNAYNGWVQSSLRKIIRYCCQNKIENSFGEIYSLISKSCITTLSARHLFAKQLPKQPILWKFYTFNAIINSINVYTLISIGDSNHEYVASENVKKCKNSIKSLHRFKLLEKPALCVMNKQFEQISNLLDNLQIYQGEDVDIKPLKTD